MWRVFTTEMFLNMTEMKAKVEYLIFTGGELMKKINLEHFALFFIMECILFFQNAIIPFDKTTC